MVEEDGKKDMDICTNITHHPAVQRHEYTLQLLKLRGSPRVELK